MRSRASFYAFAAVAIATASFTTSVQASIYPVNKCVGVKMKSAGADCKAALKAWSSYVGGGGTDTAKRDAALTSAKGKLAASWYHAEAKALSRDVDCADTTLSVDDMHTLITDAASAIAADVTTGLTLSNSADARCGAALLKAASSKCVALLRAESGYIQRLAAGPAHRDEATTKANGKFADQVASALAGCPTAATASSIGNAVDAISDSTVSDTTISPNVDDAQFTTITPDPAGQDYEGTHLHPLCAFNTPYHFFVKRGTTNKLVMYYQGGGACWDWLTCGFIGTFDKNVVPTAGTCTGGSNDGELCDTLGDCPDQGGGTACSPGSDNPNYTTTGFGDLNNPNNPIKDWNIVFVSYCTGDIHFGDSNPSYSGGMQGTANTRHFGWHNARTAEKWAREHFVNPDQVFVTGSSAGAYGAFFNAPLHHAVWPQSKFTVLADAGNGIITPDFITDHFPTWNFVAHLPDNIPGVLESITDATGIPAYTKAVADFFPDTAWGHYTSSYDGGTGGQTGFYNVMLNPNNVGAWPNWWNASCAWNTVMRQQAIQTAADVPSNYRYFIGTGSRHTMYGSNKVYTDTTGGVPTIVTWLNSMFARDGGWTNVECSSGCGVLLPGDPRPSPLQAPFEQQGPDVVVNCGP